MKKKHWRNESEQASPAQKHHPLFTPAAAAEADLEQELAQSDAPESPVDSERRDVAGHVPPTGAALFATPARGHADQKRLVQNGGTLCSCGRDTIRGVIQLLRHQPRVELEEREQRDAVGEEEVEVEARVVLHGEEVVVQRGNGADVRAVHRAEGHVVAARQRRGWCGCQSWRGGERRGTGGRGAAGR